MTAILSTTNARRLLAVLLVAATPWSPGCSFTEGTARTIGHGLSGPFSLEHPPGGVPVVPFYGVGNLPEFWSRSLWGGAPRRELGYPHMWVVIGIFVSVDAVLTLAMDLVALPVTVPAWLLSDGASEETSVQETQDAKPAPPELH